MLLNCGVGQDSWESFFSARRSNQSILKEISLNIHWKNWCWSLNSYTLATWCKELTHWKRPWCWERLKVGGEGDTWGLDGWMASLTRWTWVCASSGSWWWTGKPGMLQSWGHKESDRTEQLNWTEVRDFPGSPCIMLKSLQLCPTLWAVARQVWLSMGFSSQEYWSVLPFPSPGNLPDTGIKPVSLKSPALVGEFFTTSARSEGP